MKKLPTRGAMLFIGAMVLCALAMPSMASAASWGVVGTEHTLDSTNFGFTTTIGGFGEVSSSCSNSTLTVDVVGVFRSAPALTVTSASFNGCTAIGPNIGTCTATSTATPNPNPDWRVTAATTSNVQIHGMVVDFTLERAPGFRSALCLTVDGFRITVTGTLSGGQWTGNGANQHEVVFDNDTGFVLHGPSTHPITTRGTFRDTQQTLTLT
jgi:hypothetical protein